MIAEYCPTQSIFYAQASKALFFVEPVSSANSSKKNPALKYSFKEQIYKVNLTDRMNIKAHLGGVTPIMSWVNLRRFLLIGINLGGLQNGCTRG